MGVCDTGTHSTKEDFKSNEDPWKGENFPPKKSNNSSYKNNQNKPKASVQISQGKTADSINEQELDQLQLTESELNNFRKKMVDLINEKRSKHSANNLELNDEINQIAQAHAEKLAKEEKVEYSKNKCGGEEMSEILYQSMGNFNEEVAVKFWYQDIDDYKERSPKENNFTKLVWKISSFGGIGVSVSSDGTYYCVCDLIPSGGEFQENVIIDKPQYFVETPGGYTDGSRKNPIIN